MKRRAKLQAQIDEEESRLMSEQWELVIHKFSDIMEKCLDLEDKIEYIMENIDHHTPEVQIIPKKRGKRGKYGPRKPKVLDHKKTPPE
jgi:tetrahydromethanopterin S-methyltransferase subunit B